MSESSSHKRAKSKAAGKSGKTEAPLQRNRRIDAVISKKATEVERSGTKSGLKKAAQRLQDSRKPHKVLQVPQKDMSKGRTSYERCWCKGIRKKYVGNKKEVCYKKVILY